MKLFFKIILLALLLTSCRTAKTDTVKSKELKEHFLRQKIDSLFNLSVEKLKENTQFSAVNLSEFALETITDTAGNTPDLAYTYEINGKIVQRITVTGGTLKLKTKDSTTTVTDTEKQSETKQVEIQSETDKKEILFEKNVTKDKSVRRRNFTFGTMLVGILVVGIAVFIGIYSENN